MSRPVYVPRGKRRQPPPPRFHGAFTGGFSAGYFNTVGTREGWTPSSTARQRPEDGHDNDQDNNDRSNRPPQQRPDDFMDEQDHNEWGGPVALQAAYQPPHAENNATTSTTKASADTDAVMDQVLRLPSVNVGQRLLRVLGWRQGAESAFVPTEELRFAGQDAVPTINEDEEEHEHLSKRRLRKIRLQQQRVVIPQPKLDTAGLGFEPFENAPEFQRHRDRRRKLAQERAQEDSRKVYRVSDIWGVEDDKGDRSSSSSRVPAKARVDDPSDDPYVSFETISDFVGSKSAGGFCLREDDDDAYDDNPLEKISDKVRLDRDAYDTVVYEYKSDDDEEEEDERVSVGKSQELSFGAAAAGLGSVLSAWASAARAPGSGTTTTTTARTSDGRPPLPGFVLGGTDSVSVPTRYRGPDLPPGFEVRRHVFTEDEHPLVIQALSHAEQLIATDQAKQVAVPNALASSAAVHAPVRLAAKGVFVGVSSALKNRFTAESVSVLEKEPARPPGLSLATDKKSVGDANVEDGNSKTTRAPIPITRTVQPFAPEVLLCKRFHVPVPKNTTTTPIKASVRSREETYFYDEIMAKAVVPEHADGNFKNASGSDGASESAPDNEASRGVHAGRPSMEVYKAIYEPDLNDESESDDQDEPAKLDDSAEPPSLDPSSTGQLGPTLTNSGLSAVQQAASDNNRLVLYQEKPPQGEREEPKRSKRRSKSHDSAASSDDSRRRRKRRKKDNRKDEKRHRDERKRSKKHKKSSRSKHDR